MSELQSISDKELLAVLTEAKESGTRNHAMILVAYKHGMRASEVCNLQMSDLDLTNGQITIRRLKGSKKSVQSIYGAKGQPLLNEKKVLADWLEERETYGDKSTAVFLSQKGGALDRSAFFRVFQAIAKSAGLPKDKCNPRVLKHTRAFFYLERGLSLPEIQQALGHKSLASTGQYLKVTDDKANKAIERADANF